MSEKSVVSKVEQYQVLFEKARNETDIIKLIVDVLEDSRIFVFSEFLSLPKVAAIQNGSHSQYYNLLKLFAYGTYKTFKSNEEYLIPLTQLMDKKLKQLTLVSLAKYRQIPYDVLLEELGLDDKRKVEDIIIDAIYAGIINGKLDPKNNQLEVDDTIGRDVEADHLPVIIKTLENWCNTCEILLHSIESNISWANSEKERKIKEKAAVDQEINNVKKNLKQKSQNGEEILNLEGREATQSEKLIKKPLQKYKSSNKFWQKIL